MRIKPLSFVGAIVSFLFFASACKKDNCKNPGFSPIPHLTYLQSSSTMVTSGDEITLDFEFMDGDGDFIKAFQSAYINNSPCSGIVWFPVSDSCYLKHPNYEVFVVDSRDGIIHLGGKQALQNKAITINSDCDYEGTLHLRTPIYQKKCLGTTSPECTDTVKYRVFIRDKAGNFSNLAETDSIVVLPY